MRLNIDLGYILKRLIVIGLGFILISQLKSCNVQALTVNPTLTNCGLYYGSNTQVSGTTGTVTFNGLAYRTCTSSDTKFFTSNRFNYQGTGISTGDYIVQFLVKKTNTIVHSPSVMVLSGSDTSGLYSNFSCFVSGSDGSSLQFQTTQNGPYYYGSSDWEYYSVYCPHVTIKGGWFQVYIQSSYNANANGFNNLFAISQSFSFVPISDVSSAVSEASNQAHQDSQNIQDEMTDSDVSTSTNSSASSIFDVDIDTSHGLSSIVTAPLTLLAKAQEQCTSKSFTIFHKSITLPCGDSLFWSKDFSSYSSIFGSGVSGSQMNTIRDNFRTFWNVLFGGAIIFHLLVKLWQVINDTLDPTSDRYESMNSAIDTGGMSLRDEDELDIKLDKGSEIHNGEVRIRKPVSS